MGAGGNGASVSLSIPRAGTAAIRAKKAKRRARRRRVERGDILVR